MSGSIKLKHASGNGVIISAPSSNPASDKTINLPSDETGVFATKDSANSLQNVTGINGGQLGNRNLIINGAMQVAQRATSTTSISTTLKYGVDRFFIHNIQGTAVQTATQENDAPEGFYKSLKVLCTTADTDYSTNNQSKIEYRIEGTDIQRLNFGTANAKTLAVSFYIKSNKTGNSAIGLVNNGNNRSFVHQFNIASANTWQKVSFTVAGDTTGSWPVESDNIGIRIRWGTFGTDFQTSTLDAWQAGQKMATSNSPINFNAATNDYLQITGVQLEVGDSATDFEHRSYAQELALCQRYCQKNIVILAVAQSTNALNMRSTLFCEMRATPTVSKIAADGSANSSIFVFGDCVTVEDESTDMPSIVGSYGGNQVSVAMNLGGFDNLTQYRSYRHEPQSTKQAILLFDAEL